MLFVQNLIHRLEVGSGLRFLKYFLLLLALLALLLTYNFRGFKNFSNPEAMDAAQLARNLAEHRGYTTYFIRPFSIYLLQRTYGNSLDPKLLHDLPDSGRVESMHPDLANPPLYPLALAAVMKVAPVVRYEVARGAALKVGGKSINAWNRSGGFAIYPPDFWISLFNQGIFLVIAVMIFLLARQLFDTTVAWMSAILFLGSDLFWRFSMSGLSTMLAMLIFLALAWSITLLEQNVREGKSARGCLGLAALAGALLGLGCLTRYAFGWLLIPTLVFLLIYSGSRRWYVCLVTLAVFAVIVGPWVARNYHLSDTLFGTAGYAMYENTPFFPEFHLGRSLSPNLTTGLFYYVVSKALANTRNILQEEMLGFAGSWISAFFLVGLLVTFKNPTLSRLRYFVVLCLPFLIGAQALGRTQLSENSPVINSENLLVLAAPLVIIFGASLFFILLDQLKLPLPQFKIVLTAVFALVMCLPAILNLFSRRTNPVAYPPYFPPAIQAVSDWMKPDELIMSDVPWAVAWYGNRQSVWLGLNANSDFQDFNAYQKSISAIYLTPVTTDSHIISQLLLKGDPDWGGFLLKSVLSDHLPAEFPLDHIAPGLLPEQLFLTDADRWARPAPATAAK